MRECVVHGAAMRTIFAVFRSRIPAFVGISLALLLTTLTSATELPQLQVVRPGVYAVIQPLANRFNDSNSAVIVLGDDLLVVDSQTELSTTSEIVGQIQKVVNKPVRYVVITHWHGDHVQGNQIYRENFPAVQFIAQEKTREDMASRATADLRENVEHLPSLIANYQKMLSTGKKSDGTILTPDEVQLVQMRVEVFSRELPDLEKTHIVLPDITFASSLTFYGNQREVRLLHYEGHTRGDVVVFLPAERILVRGDILDDMPYVGDGSPADLVRTLKALDGLDFDIVIPGHGQIEHGHEHLRLIASLFESIVSQVNDAVRTGLSLEDTKKKVNVAPLRDAVTGGEEHAMRAFDGWVPVAVERAYKEATPQVR
jgi:cyclase